MDFSLLPFFQPKGVVVIGASTSPEKLGYGVARDRPGSLAVRGRATRRRTAPHPTGGLVRTRLVEEYGWNRPWQLGRTPAAAALQRNTPEKGAPLGPPHTAWDASREDCGHA